MTAVTPGRAARHGLTLAWRGLLHIRHSPGQLLDLILQPMLFVVLFVFLFGGAIATDWREYLQFVLPGIMVQSVVLTTVASGATLNHDLATGIFDRFRSLPIARSAPLVGAVLGDAARYPVSGGVVLIFGLALGFHLRSTPAAALAAIALMVLFALSVCWISALIGVVARTPQRTQMLCAMVMFPLTFGSSVYVPTATLPGWLYIWAEVNPVSALADAVRALLLGGAVRDDVMRTLVAAGVVLAVFAPLTVVAYLRRMRA
jgi:oleandomycin transport system permease protein